MMTIKTSHLSFLFPISLCLLSATFSLASHREDPDQWQCQQQCRHEQQYEVCVLSCERHHREKQEREGRRGHDIFESRESESEWKSREEEQQQKEGYPYFFDYKSLRTCAATPQGHARALESIGRESEILRGLENYNVGILEANPNAFIMPHHMDAECVLFVSKGQGAITIVHPDKRETHNLERGDILVVPAGTTCYLFNRDNNKKLRIVKLMQSVSGAGNVQVFVGPGGRNPESFYKAFSPEILEAALNTHRDKIEGLFGQQDQGSIVRASPEQIKALSQQSASEGGGIWPFGGESKDREPFNLFNKRPLQANDHGQLFEANPSDHKQLRHLNIGVSFANISRGSIFGPFYNSRATKISVVVKGNGHVEIACPHLARQQQHRGGRRGGSQEQESDLSYQRVSSNVSPGDVFIVPAGHPVVSVASESRNPPSENLQIMCFEINFDNNERVPLAGGKNVISQLDEQVQELSFNQESKAVKQVFDNQPRSFFFPGPSQRQGGGRAYE